MATIRGILVHRSLGFVWTSCGEEVAAGGRSGVVEICGGENRSKKRKFSRFAVLDTRSSALLTSTNYVRLTRAPSSCEF